jgi:hypothetical protein
MVHVLQAIMYSKRRIQGLNMAVDFGMMEMMNIKLLEGRYFNSHASDTTIM